MNDEHPHHAYRHLHHFICMWVIHKRAMLTQGKFVNIGLAGFDLWLSKAADAIHAIRQQDTVPVNGRMFPQPVGDQQPYPIAFNCFNRRSRCAAIITPAFDFHARCKLLFKLLRDEMKFLDSIFYFPRKQMIVRQGQWGSCLVRTELFLTRCSRGTGLTAEQCGDATGQPTQGSRG